MKRGSTLLPPNHIYQKAMALNVCIPLVIIFLYELLLALSINEAIVSAQFSHQKSNACGICIVQATLQLLPSNDHDTHIFV